MGALLLGALALVAILLLLRLYVGADPKALAKSARYLGAGLLALVAIGLAAVNRIGLAMLAGSFAWGLFTGGRVMPGGWHLGYPFGSRGGGRAPQTDQVTKVRTAWLEMTLNHATGAMDGRVLKGANAGSALHSMPQRTLAALYREIQAVDDDSERLLESYLDRRFGKEWRDSGERASQRGRRKTGMTRDEALRVLGLHDGDGEEAIRAAHRHLMMQNHPDRGGSDYLAAKINEAKDVLLNS